MPPSSPRAASPTNTPSTTAHPASPTHQAHTVADTYTYITASSLTDSFVAVSPVPSSAMASPILAPTPASGASAASGGLRVQPPTYADVVKGAAVVEETPRASKRGPSIDDHERTPVAAARGTSPSPQHGWMGKSKSKTKKTGQQQENEAKQVSLTSKMVHFAFEKFFSHFLHGFLFGALANFRYEVQLAGGLWRMVFRRPLPPPTVGQMADPMRPRRLPAGW